MQVIVNCTVERSLHPIIGGPAPQLQKKLSIIWEVKLEEV